MDYDRIRNLAERLLAELPPKPQDGLAQVLEDARKLAGSIHSEWFLSEVEESDVGYEFQTFGPHKPPHYEESLAEFYPGNHGTEPAELILLLFNNIDAILDAAQRGIVK